MKVVSVEAMIKSAKSWAENQDVDPPLLSKLPDDRRYGYASTKHEGVAHDPAIVATKENWTQWQDIVRRSKVTVHATTMYDDVRIPPLVVSLSVDCPHADLPANIKHTTIAHACIQPACHDVRYRPAAEPAVGPVPTHTSKVASNAVVQASTWNRWSNGWSTWNRWSIECRLVVELVEYRLVEYRLVEYQGLG